MKSWKQICSLRLPGCSPLLLLSLLTAPTRKWQNPALQTISEMHIHLVNMEILQKIAQLPETSWISTRTQLQKEEKGQIFPVNIHHTFLHTGFNVDMLNPPQSCPNVLWLFLMFINQPLIYEPISSCSWLEVTAEGAWLLEPIRQSKYRPTCF